MKNIELVKPVVLRSRLGDMTPTENMKAVRMLGSRERFEGKYGSEAVVEYRESLGLPDVSIRTIPVQEILEAVDDYTTLYDILYFLTRLNHKNNRMKRLMELNAPEQIMECEYQHLYLHVSYLQDNNWCGKPVTVEIYEGEEPVPRKSLVDIGFEL